MKRALSIIMLGLCLFMQTTYCMQEQQKDESIPQNMNTSMVLWAACSKNNIDLAALIIKNYPNNININISERQTLITPLMHTTYHHDHKIFDMLMNKLPDLNKQDCYNDTALTHAARAGHVYAIHKLMYAGANSSLCNDSGLDPLHTSLRHFWMDSIKALVSHASCNINSQEKTSNNTPLITLAQTASYKVELLGVVDSVVVQLVKTAKLIFSPFLTKKNTVSVTEINTKETYLTKLFIFLGADLHAVNIYGKTALACAQSNPECPQEIRDLLNNPQKIRDYCDESEIKEFEHIQAMRQNKVKKTILEFEQSIVQEQRK